MRVSVERYSAGKVIEKLMEMTDSKVIELLVEHGRQCLPCSTIFSMHLYE